MKELIEYIARTLAEHPDLVEVRELDSPRRLELRVAQADLGRIIGRRGRTAQAMRTLLRVSAGDEGSAELDIVQGTEPAPE